MTADTFQQFGHAGPEGPLIAHEAQGHFAM